MPASIASSRCWAMSWVKIGVSASRPITTPAWRAEIVQPPWIACGARPRERGLGQRREHQREADADQDLRRHGQRDLGLRQQRQAAEAAGDEDRAGRGAGPGARHERRRAGCRGAPRAASPMTTIAAPIGRQPPAFDQQQDEQEERRGDRRRDQRQGEVGQQVRAAGPAQLGLRGSRSPPRAGRRRGSAPRRRARSAPGSGRSTARRRAR